MSTKVKGEAIKEGSVPLSALADEVKDKIENAGGYEFLLDIGNDTEEHIANWVKICNDSRFYYPESGTYPNYKGNCTFQIGAGIIQFEYSVLEHDMGNIRVGGTIFSSYNDVEEFPIGNYIKTNVATNDPTTITIGQCTFLTKSGADWNAQEGEAGYIENRTHYLEHTEVLNIQTKHHSNINVSEYAYLEFFINGHYEIQIKVQDGYFEKVLDKYTNPYDTHPYFSGQIENGVLYFDIDDWEDADPIVQIIGPKYIKLSEGFIPDTVVKTVPQTLTDVNKNQALTNLGIDPVVWKYICNPFLINNYTSCPEELLDEEGNLKYQIPSMYIVHYNGEYCGPISWISARAMGTFYNNGSYFEANLDNDGEFTITQMTTE